MIGRAEGAHGRVPKRATGKSLDNPHSFFFFSMKCSLIPQVLP